MAGRTLKEADVDLPTRHVTYRARGLKYLGQVMVDFLRRGSRPRLSVSSIKTSCTARHDGELFGAVAAHLNRTPAHLMGPTRLRQALALNDYQCRLPDASGVMLIRCCATV